MALTAQHQTQVAALGTALYGTGMPPSGGISQAMQALVRLYARVVDVGNDPTLSLTSTQVQAILNQYAALKQAMLTAVGQLP